MNLVIIGGGEAVNNINQFRKKMKKEQAQTKGQEEESKIGKTKKEERKRELYVIKQYSALGSGDSEGNLL